jgi:methionyl-tRNA formyltransferase
VRLVLFGTSTFALPTFKALLSTSHELAAVVTQPDRPAGRGHAPSPPALKMAAEAHSVPVLQPANVNAPESLADLRATGADVFIVASYGQILRRALLEIPRRGSLNVHASLLPRHRGASPVAAAILSGDEVTGVSIMEVVRALDAGPVVATVVVPILPLDTTGTLEERLARAGAVLLADCLDGWAVRDIEPRAQDEAGSTYAPQIKREDALLDWFLPAPDLWRRVRAYNPWPIAFTYRDGEELRVFQAWPLEGTSGASPGTVLPPEQLPPDSGVAAPMPLVQTGDGRLALITVQRPGRRALSGIEFLRGQRALLGSVLGTPA